jgi:hypothetical protein
MNICQLEPLLLLVFIGKLGERLEVILLAKEFV